jgi:hypothetical protein
LTYVKVSGNIKVDKEKDMCWTVTFSKEVKKEYKKLERSGSKKPSIIDIIDLLALDLQKNEPNLHSWPHYAHLSKDHFHCHLRKGHPTYVACWKIIDKQMKQIEVYYVGSHENAPY